MRGSQTRWSVLMALATLIGSGGHLSAGDLYPSDPARTEAVALPKPADVQALTAHPAQIVLKGSDDAQQVLLTARLPGDRLQDLSGDAEYTIADTSIDRGFGGAGYGLCTASPHIPDRGTRKREPPSDRAQHLTGASVNRARRGAPGMRLSRHR